MSPICYNLGQGQECSIYVLSKEIQKNPFICIKISSLAQLLRNPEFLNHLFFLHDSRKTIILVLVPGIVLSVTRSV